MEVETVVVIVGAGPSGLAIAACLNSLSIPNIILEREDDHSSLWKKKTYDRLSLHLTKSYSSLPLMSPSWFTSQYMSKNTFISYLDSYVSKFNIEPKYNHSVELALFDESNKKWKVEAKNNMSGEIFIAISKFLIVATGENSDPIFPKLPGLETFGGEILHSSAYKCGLMYSGKNVLVVGSGNSGTEIACDLTEHEANATIVIRTPFHIFTKRMVYIGMLSLFQCHLPMVVVDKVVVAIAKHKYGDLSGYGIITPDIGPFRQKATTGRTPVIDSGFVDKIRSQKIRVVPEILKIKGNRVEFKDESEYEFDAIIMATGFRSVANNWLKDYKYVLNEDGLPKRETTEQYWKGENGIYCIGMSGRGIPGISSDAEHIANDISYILKQKEKLLQQPKPKNTLLSKFLNAYYYFTAFLHFNKPQ